LEAHNTFACVSNPPRYFGRLQLRDIHTEAKSFARVTTWTGEAIAKYLVQITLVFLAYLIAGKLGQATATIRSSNLGPVWPAYGVALAAFLRFGYRIWPGIVASAFLVAFLNPVPLLSAGGQAAGATTAALVGCLLLRQIADFDPSLPRLRDALGLIVVGAFGSAILSATIGLSALYASHLQAYDGLGPAWLIYWLGDSTGVLLVTPLAFTLPSLLRIRSRYRIAEFAALLALLTAACFIVFGDFPFVTIKLHVFAFSVLPFVIWAAIVFGVGGTAVCIFLIATIATIETALGSGPFAASSSLMNGVLLDVFFGVLAISGLILASATTEGKNAEKAREELIRAQAAMDARSAERSQTEEALAGMSRKLLRAQEQERSRIARELHDDINQRLALLSVEIQRMREANPITYGELRSRMDELGKRTSEISAVVQSLSHELHSSKLEYLGLASAMKGFCREFGDKHKAEVAFDSEGMPATVPHEISLCLFRVTQEGLQNAVKHSGVRRFEVKLNGSPTEIHLTIRDSGVGFDPELAKGAQGLGLISMQERVSLVKGTISINSKPHSGTEINVRVPLSAGIS
jgi:signal transduction histidine kinase